MPDPLSRTDRLEQAHAYRLQRLGRMLRFHLLKVLAPADLTPEQFMILFRLKERDGRSQKELVDPAFDDRANITHLVRQLERARLVARSRDDNDARQRLVWLTDAGRARLDRVLQTAIEVRAALFGDFSPEELDQLMRFVDRIEARLASAEPDPTEPDPTEPNPTEPTPTSS